jgi:hypothetical protein
MPHEVEVNGNLYFFSSSDWVKTRPDAAADCKQRGSSLISPLSDREYASLRHYLDNNAEKYWVGLESLDSEFWDDGTAAHFDHVVVSSGDRAGCV